MHEKHTLITYTPYVADTCVANQNNVFENVVGSPVYDRSMLGVYSCLFADATNIESVRVFAENILFSTFWTSRSF